MGGSGGDGQSICTGNQYTHDHSTGKEGAGRRGRMRMDRPGALISPARTGPKRDVPRGREQISFIEHSRFVVRSSWLKADVSAVSVAPGRARVAAIIGDEVRVWNAATGKLADQIRFKDESPFSLRFSPDQCTLAVGVSVPQSRRWGVRIMHCHGEGHQAEPRGESYEGRQLALSRDGRTLALTLQDRRHTSVCSASIKHLFDPLDARR